MRNLFILGLALLSIEGFAQNGPMLINAPRDSQPIDPSYGIWSSMVTNSNKSLWNKPKNIRKRTSRETPMYPITTEDLVAEMTKAAKKENPRIHYSYLLAVENTVDEETGLTTLRWADGSSYVGLTDRGAMFVGTMTYADGSKYIGKWERNQPNGEGTFITPEGIAFTGKFKNGVPYGKCIMQDVDGRLYSARWVRGVLKEKSIKPLEEE